MILTIGHSNHETAGFIEMLSRHGVTAVADVRSSPHSSRFPHFCKKAIKESLLAADIAYVYLGAELGGRPSVTLLNAEGFADYPRMAEQSLFKEGLGRLTQGADRYRLAVMCSEADPADCHRALLIGRQLATLGLPVGHILRDGSIETHAQFENRLLTMARLTHSDLFSVLDERIDAAYQHRAARVAWRAEMPEIEE